jgi:hypothetical protein
MKSVRIEIPQNPSDVAELASAIKAKHEDLGKNSPLANLPWDDKGPKIEQVATFDQQAAELHRQAQNATERRDVLLPEITEFVRSTRDVLLGLNRSNPRALSEFGFEVSDAVHAKKTANGDGKTP